MDMTIIYVILVVVVLALMAVILMVNAVIEGFITKMLPLMNEKEPKE